MKYDFFKDFDKHYGLDCVKLYSKLFNKVKFIPKTWSIISGFNNNKEYLSVLMKDPNEDRNHIVLYANIFKAVGQSYHIHEMCFRYDNVEYYISNIRISSEGISYDYECYILPSMKDQIKSEGFLIPDSSKYKQNNIEPDLKGSEEMPDYYDNNIIGYIIGNYFSKCSPDTNIAVSRVRE